jgi:hypothetical protein
MNFCHLNAVHAALNIVVLASLALAVAAGFNGGMPLAAITAAMALTASGTFSLASIARCPRAGRVPLVLRPTSCVRR